MSIDTRLKSYWTNAKLWHRTGDYIWMSLLELMALTEEGPGGRAASRLTKAHDKELAVDSS